MVYKSPTQKHTWIFDLYSVISGVGELNPTPRNNRTLNELLPTPQPADTPYPDCPYLLLDVRDRDQYDLCHIISGRWQEA